MGVGPVHPEHVVAGVALLAEVARELLGAHVDLEVRLQVRQPKEPLPAQLAAVPARLRPTGVLVPLVTEIGRPPQEPLEAVLALEARRPVGRVRRVLVRYLLLFGPECGAAVLALGVNSIELLKIFLKIFLTF